MTNYAKSRRPHRPERDRMIFEVLRAIRNQTDREVAAKTYVSPSTIRNWRNNTTRYPQHHTLSAVAATVGMEFKLVRKDGT